MNDALRRLAARKELLLARSRLHRLELRQEARMLRRSLARPTSWLRFAGAPLLRPLLLSAVTLAARRGRWRILAGAAVATAAAVVAARFVLGSLARHRESDAHREWLIDEAGAESFPASDPSAIAQPHSSDVR